MKTESASSLSLALITGSMRCHARAHTLGVYMHGCALSAEHAKRFFNKRQTPLLCKTLAVVAQRVNDGGVELAATCVLAARDDVRLAQDAAAVALGIFAEDDANVFSESSNVSSSSATSSAHRQYIYAVSALANEPSSTACSGSRRGRSGRSEPARSAKSRVIEAETEAESRATKMFCLLFVRRFSETKTSDTAGRGRSRSSRTTPSPSAAAR